MKTIPLLYLFLCILHAPKSYCIKNVTPNNQIDIMDINKTMPDKDKIDETDNPETVLTRIFSFISKGNNLKMQYKFLLPKLASLIQTDSVYNPFKLICFIPYLVFSVNVVNASNNKRDTFSSADLEGLNLASIFQNPEHLKKLFLKKSNSEFAINSIKILAGYNASEIIDKLAKEVKRKAVENRNGVYGINGERLNDLLRNSSDFKNLFPSDELANMGLNYLNAYMNILVSTIEKEKLNKVKTVRISPRSINLDVSNTAQNVFRGTLSDSVAAFFTVGQTKIHEIAGDNLQTLGDSSGTASSVYLNDLTSLIFNKTPNTVFKYFSIAGSLTANSFFIPNLIAYFLPVSIDADAFRFMCLMAYIMIIAKKKSEKPDIGYDKNEIQVLNTDQVVDTINNREVMSNLFPNNDMTSKGVGIIKFLAGPDAEVVDRFVKEIQKLTTVKDKNGNLKKLTITEVLKNTALFKKLYQLKNYVDSTIKEYLGLNNTIKQNQNSLPQNDEKKQKRRNAKALKKKKKSR